MSKDKNSASTIPPLPGGTTREKEKNIREPQEGERVLSSGAIMDESTGKLVGHVGHGGTLFTSDTARAAIVKRWDDQRRSFADGIIEGMLEDDAAGDMPTGREGDKQAWQAVGKKVAQLLKNSKSSRGVAELLRAMAELAGYTPDRLQIAIAEKQGEGPPLISNETASKLLDFLRETQAQRENAEGKVIDVQTE